MQLGKRQINISIRYDKKCLMIVVVNTYDGIVNCMMVALGIALIMLIVGKFKNVYMKNLLKGGNKYD